MKETNSLSIVNTEHENDFVKALSTALIDSLKKGKKTLWLIPGGSNIKAAVACLNKIVEKVSIEELANLKITLTDERYGPVGHADSNWQQMIEAGFAFDKVDARPLLIDQPLEETVKKYSETLNELFAWSEYVIAQFGIGADGHIAGVLPHTIGVSSDDMAVGYDSALFTRLSVSLKKVEEFVDEAYVFVFGQSKKEALTLLTQEGSMADTPCRVLRRLPKAVLYTDQLIS